ncbi:hypothetical protein LF1_49700 [Rubripirellula obstinata]|uniref:Uncharacterized protein n=1 Tax=Rubripirellula obstinata TaxID=406547 RepID=A0A5B1CPC7_9BACT|nr:hypothetical protein [Rubripirellula obstinata]KAA1262406.1 hypothetical protein LF1_49700 [Rubripirellula obstinata]
MNSIAPYFQRIRSVVIGLVLIAMTLPFGGCRICADCEDLDYPAYGGAWQRTLRQSGRVGSVFDPGGAKAATLVDKTTPDEPDEIERSRQEARDNDDDLDPDERDADDEDDSDEKSESMKDREEKLRQQELDDIESEEEESELRKKGLDDIEVRIVPGRGPVMIKTN